MTDPNILEMALQRSDWSLERDPNNLTLPMAPKQKTPECHCPQPSRNRLGGCVPSIDREEGVIRCRSCLKPISSRCKRKDVVHLRGLLNAPEGHTDWESVPDLIWHG